MQILRPNATYEVSGLEITHWNDERSKPTTAELLAMIDAIEEFEKQKVIYVTKPDSDEMELVNSEEFLKELAKTNS